MLSLSFLCRDNSVKRGWSIQLLLTTKKENLSLPGLSRGGCLSSGFLDNYLGERV